MRATTARSHTGARRGFTLLELLTVLAILSILMGMGIGVLSRVNFAKYGAASMVARVLRSARESAIASGLPVAVVCDPETNRIFDLSVRPLGFWHFEDADTTATKGAYGLDARLVGARLDLEGRFGSALSCSAPGEYAEVSIGERSGWELATGLAVEADVFPRTVQASTIVQRGRQFRLLLTSDGAAEARVGLSDGPLDTAKDAGEAIATTPPGCVPPNRWSRVGFVYDRLALTVLVDGVPRASKVATDFVRREIAPLTISSKSDSFLGLIDELRVGAIVPGDGEALPKDVAFARAAGRVAVRFTGEGMLDPAFHHAAVPVALRFPEGEIREVVVGPYGTVR